MSLDPERIASRALNYRSYYQQLIRRGKPLNVINDLHLHFPEFSSELEILRAHYHEVKRQIIAGTISQENASVEQNRVNMALLAFLNDLSRGETTLAARHLAIGDEANSVLDELLKNQLKFSENAVRENKVFRTAVGLLFLISIFFSAIVAFNHFDFLLEDLKVIGLLATNILLYICIGVLAMLALSLIIKGGVNNQDFLNFSKKTLKL